MTSQNPYLETLRSTEGAATETQDEENPYAETLRQDREKQRVVARIAVKQASQTSPDRQAEVLRLSEKFGFGPAIIERNFERFQQKDRAEVIGSISTERPRLGEWLTKPENVALAQDDLPQLSAIDKLLDIVKALPAGAAEALGMGETGLVDLNAALSRRILAAVRGVPGVGAGIADVLETPAPRFLNYPAAVERHGRGLQQFGRELVPLERRTLPVEIAAGVGQLAGQVATALVGGEYVSLAQLLGQGAAQISETAKAKGVSGTPEADTAILAGAGITAITERYGLEQLLERVPPNIRNGLLRYIADLSVAGGKEAAQEFTEGVLQNIAIKLAIDPNQPIVQDLSRQAIVAGSSGAIARAILNAAVPGRARPINRALQAQENVEVLRALPEAVRNSKTFHRLPEAVQQFIRNALTNSAGGTVYVPVEQFETYFQDKGQNPAEVAAALTGDPGAFEQSLLTGQRLAVPIERYATAVSAEHAEFFATEAAIGDPDAMSFNEATEHLRQLEDDAQQVTQEPETRTFEESARKVAEDIRGQLLGQGHSTEAIDAHAVFVEQAFLSMGRRAGVDPFELYSRYNLTIQRELPAILQQARRLDATDVLLDRLRSGAVPQEGEVFGKSLVTFLRDAGGIQDQGGELASLEVDADRKRGERNLVQEKGLPLDTAREMAAEAGYLPEESSVAEFLDAIEREVRGQPVYSQQTVDAEKLDLVTALQQLESYLQQAGVDLATTPNEEVKKKFFQGEEFGQPFKHGEKRGFVVFGPEGQVNITLTPKANLSTALHELAHFYLNLFGDIAEDLQTRPGEMTPDQQRIVDDYQVILKWLGVNSRDGIKTEQHETFARGIEAYVTEGQAPSAALRSVFARFRSWLIGAYRLFKASTRENIGKALQVQLSDEVRVVFDRMLASDDAIAQAEQDARVEGLFENEKIRQGLGLSSEQFGPYKKLVDSARDAARDKLDAQLAQEQARASESWWKERRAEVRADVAREVNNDKGYQALAAIQHGKMPDGSERPEGAFRGKLDAAALEARYGKYQDSPTMQTLKKLFVYRREGGVSPDVAAEFFGFRSGEELVSALLLAGERPFKEFVDAETDSRMRQQYGDSLLDGTITEKAKAAVMTEGRSEVLHEELKILQRNAGK